MNILTQLMGASPVGNLKIIIEEGAYLVDVRTPAEFAGGHVKGSVNIPLDTVPDQLSKFRNKKNIVVFCQSGSRSYQAKAFLEQNGFTNVINGGTWNYVNQFCQ